MKLSRLLEYSLVVSMLFLAVGAYPATAQVSSPTPTFDAGAAAEQLSGQVGAKFGSQDAIRQNAVNPMTAGTPMTSVTGTTPFNAPVLNCPSSHKFLDVTIIPDNGTGDIAGVYVQQDTDFDNIFDYAYTEPFPVSGVCGNGVISCDPASWNNCKYYKWIADSSAKVRLLQGSMQDLGGCFCVNNSCGNALVVNQMGYILSILGGGVVGAIQAVNPKCTVSNSNTGDMTISYYGQNSAQCAAPFSSLSSGTSNPEQYYGSPSAMDAASQAEVSAQMSNPGSAYNTLQSLSAATASSSSYRTCTVQDVAFVNTAQQSPTYQWYPWLDIMMECEWGRDSVNSCQYYVQVDTNSDGVYDRTDVITTGPGTGSGWASAESPTVMAPYPPQVVQSYQSQYNVPATSVAQSTLSQPTYQYTTSPPCVMAVPVTLGLANNAYWNRVDGGGTGMDKDCTLYDVQYQKMSPPICDTTDSYQYDPNNVMCYLDTLSDNVVDNCSSLETDPACTLMSEVVDNVQTYSNFNPTGLVPLSSCRTVTGAIKSFNVCHDWWVKNRAYLCHSPSAYDFSVVKERAANIANTASLGNGSFSYQDKTPDGSGGWTYTSNTVSVDTSGGASSCMTACKTRKPATDTQASLTGNASQADVSTSRWQFFYKSCVGGSCPVDKGEQVLIDCQCISEFADAASIMETLNQAGKDVICSDGTKQ